MCNSLWYFPRYMGNTNIIAPKAAAESHSCSRLYSVQTEVQKMSQGSRIHRNNFFPINPGLFLTKANFRMHKPDNFEFALNFFTEKVAFYSHTYLCIGPCVHICVHLVYMYEYTCSGNISHPFTSNQQVRIMYCYCWTFWDHFRC